MIRSLFNSLIGIFLILFIFSASVYGQEEITQELTKSGFRQYLLNNGLKVILIKDKAFPFVSCFTWYKVGSRDDPAGMTGLAHLVEHLLFQNIGNFTGNLWANSIVRCGGEFSGFTSEDFTAFYANVPNYQLELAIKGEAERMRNARFSKLDVTREIEHLVKEAKAEEEEDSVQMLNREVHALAYEKHPYRNPPGGWRHELEHLTYDQARAHYNKYFYPNNASLILAGDFNEQLAVNLIERYFGSLAKTETLPLPIYVQERPQLAQRQIKLKADTDKESVVLAYRVPGIGYPDASAIAVLEQYLNAQLLGPLHERLVDTGLCSSLQAAYEQKKDPSLLIIRCSGISVNNSDKVMQILDGALSQIKAHQLGDADVKRLTRQAEFSYYADGDGPYRCAFQTGFFATLTNTSDPSLWPQKITQVTAADLMRVAKLYLNDENRVVGQITSANGNHANENKKTNLSVSNTRLAHTIANKHLHLAAYQSGAVTPNVVQNSATGQSSAVGLIKTSTGNKVMESQFQCKTLRNGLSIVVLESHLSPLVQVMGAIKAGSIYEHPDGRGMSKLLSAVFDLGNTRANWQQIVSAQTDLGLPPSAMLKFEPGIENITFQTNCISRDFPAQSGLLFSSLMEPRLQSNDFDTAKTSVANFLRRSEKNPNVRIERTLLRSLIAPNCAYYPLHPDEEINAISNFKLADLIDFYHERVNPALTTIVVCGDVQAKQVFDLFEQLSQGWLLDSQVYGSPSAIKNLRQPPLIISNRNAYKGSFILPASLPAQLVLGRIIPVSNAKQVENYWAALLVADCALNSHPIISHLNEQFDLKPDLSEEAGIESWYAKILKLSNKLIWSLHIEMPGKSSSSSIVTAVQNEIAQYSKCGLRQEEVSEAKKYLIGSIPVKECSDLTELTQFICKGIIDFNEVVPLAKVQRIINSLRYEDINEFIAKVFRPQYASVVVAGPKDLIKEVHPIKVESVEENSD